jgi:hypothetical protein
VIGHFVVSSALEIVSHCVFGTVLLTHDMNGVVLSEQICVGQNVDGSTLSVSYFHSHGLRAAVLNFVRPGYLLSEQDFTNEFVDPITKGRNKDASDGMVALTLASKISIVVLLRMREARSRISFGLLFVARTACFAARLA